MDRKILIVSYSYTGNTHRIASVLRDLTGGDWCEIYPRHPYPIDFEKRLRQVRKEVDKGYLPSLMPGTIHPKDYTTIFIGSPNWCGTIAPPIASYLAKNSFSGKTLLPFFSHCGGGNGNGKLEIDIRHLCKGADIGSSFSAINDGGDELVGKVSDWLSELGIEPKESVFTVNKH